MIYNIFTWVDFFQSEIDERNEIIAEKYLSEYDAKLYEAVNYPKNFQCVDNLEKFSVYQMKEILNKVCKL